jgi:hypothetical protein
MGHCSDDVPIVVFGMFGGVDTAATLIVLVLTIRIHASRAQD